MDEGIRELPETAVPHEAAVRRTRDVKPAEYLEVSVYLTPLAARPGSRPDAAGRRETRTQLRARQAIEHSGDISAMGAFAARHGLRVVSAEPERRRVRLAGSAARFGAAFGTSLGVYDAGEGEFRSYSGALSVPENLGDRIESVLGLDSRRVAGDRADGARTAVHFAPFTVRGWVRELASVTSAPPDAARTGLGVPAGGRPAALLTSTVRSGAALAATAWWDGQPHLRVFGQNPQWDLGQFGWDGDWTPGRSLPGAAPKTKPYARQWFGPQGTVTSVFYQDARNTLRELRETAGRWAPGPFVVPGAAPGTGIAVVTWSDGGGVHMRAYYQDAQNTVREEVYENGGWGPGAVIAAGSAPRGNLAAVQWFDSSGIHLRVYYQDTQNTVREQCFDVSGWQPGHQFTAPAAAPGTGLAAAFWSDAGTNAGHLRVYYQDGQNTVCEQSADSGQWQARYLADAAPGSGLAAAHWLDAAGGGHVRVYYQDPQNAIREQCYDAGRWVTGQFVVPPR